MATDESTSCPQCQHPAVPGSVFCEECGARLGMPPDSDAGKSAGKSESGSAAPEPAPRESSPRKRTKKKGKVADQVILTWDAAIPMVGNRFFMWDMAKLWAMSCGVLFVFALLLAAVEHSGYMLRFAFVGPPIAFAGFFIASLLIALIFFFNKYYAQTVISERGVQFELVKWTGKLSQAVAAGNLVLGVLKSSPTAVGVGLLADTQRSVFMPWSQIRKVAFFPRQRVITVSNSWRPVFRLHCPDDEIYRQARDLLETKVPEGGGSLRRS